MKRFMTTMLALTALPLAACALDDSTSVEQITQESHSWGNYHWARSANPLNLDLGDNVSSAWDSYLATASSDWTSSSVLNTGVVAGAATTRKCRATAGRVEVCAATYGRNGWLGIASIWANGDHITQATVKMNDTYFNSATYDTPAWRNMVMCQEVGHTFGLDHQDENFDNPPLGTCMDYTSDPTPNQHPNAHDYEQLETIYAHLDGAASAGSGHGNSGNFGDPDDWGDLVDSSADGRHAVYLHQYGDGRRIVTHVLYAE